jgi:hypothetical protein
VPLFFVTAGRINLKTLKNPDQFGPKTDIQKEMQAPSKSREKMPAVLEQAVHLRDKALQARKKTDEQRQEDAEVRCVYNTSSISTSQSELFCIEGRGGQSRG